MSNVVDTNLPLTRIFGYEHEHGHDLHHVQFTSSDLNGDGLFDIVLVHQLTSEMKCCIAIFYGRLSFPNELNVRDLPNLIDLTGSLHQFIPSMNGFQFVFGSQFLVVGSSGDINGDGYQDILFKTTGRFSYFFLGSKADNPLSLLCTSNGNETEFIDLPVLYKAEIEDQVHSMAVGDLDLDGFDDTIFLIDSQSKTNPMKQILIKFGLPILSGKLDNCESPSLFQNSTRRWDAPSKHITSLVMTDVDGDGRKDFILFEMSQITILFTTAEFHQQVRSFEKFPRIHLIVSNPVATTAFFALGDIDHDSFPDFRMEVRILPGSLLAGYYPSRLPTISPTKQVDENEFRVKSFMEKYVRALIQELIFIVFVLLMGIILFLAVTGCKAQGNHRDHKLKKPIEKKELLRNKGIEMTRLLTVEDPRQDIEQEEDDIMNG